jgi:hypothetical protein
MAKTKQKPSALNDLLKTVRRLIVCVIAAIGLYHEAPYDVLLVRLLILSAALYLISGMFELLFQYLSYRAHATAHTAGVQSATVNAPPEQA